MENPKYLWNNNYYSHEQTIFVYLNENDEKIYGHIVSDSDKIYPYSDKSIYKNATCLGLAVKYVNSYKSPHYIGLTDISNNEYKIMNDYWKGVNLNR